MESRPVALHCYPRGDAEFEASANDALAGLLVRNARIDDVARALQTNLRRRFPLAIVHRRDRLAEPFEERCEVLYVYRDGTPIVTL